MRKIFNFLNSSGFQYFKKNATWTLVAQVITTFCGLGTTFILANLLSPNDFGQFKFLTTWTALAFGFSYTGYTFILTQKVSKNEQIILSNIFKKSLFKSSHVFIFLLLACIYYFYKENYVLSIGFFLTIFLTIGNILSPLANCILVGFKKFNLTASFASITNLLQLLFVTLTAYFTHNILLTISSFLFAGTIGFLVNTFFVYYKFSKALENNKKIPDHESAFEESSASKLNLSGIFGGLAYQSDKLLIFHFLGAAPLAIYAIAIAISDQARGPIKSVTGILLPKFSEGVNKEKVKKIFYLTSILSVFLTLFVIYLNPLIFKYFFPLYQEYIFTANLAAIALSFSGSGILLSYLQSQKNFEAMLANTNTMTNTMIILYPIAVFIFKSIDAVVIARNLVVISCFVVNFYYFQKN